jgi:hypothetical protein
MFHTPYPDWMAHAVQMWQPPADMARQVSPEEVEAFRRAHLPDSMVFEVEAASGMGVDAAFMGLIENVRAKIDLKAPHERHRRIATLGWTPARHKVSYPLLAEQSHHRCLPFRLR